MMHCNVLNALLLSTGLMAIMPSASADVVSPVVPQSLGEEVLDMAGSKVRVRVLKVTLPKGWKQSEHIHPVSGPRYVLKGRIRLISDSKRDEFGPGQVFWENGVAATSENISDGDVDLLVTEMVPEASPPRPARANNGKSSKGAVK